MKSANRIADWLESHWVTPAYSGWLLSGLSLFFFLAATNTLSGWLYVISGISFALLAIAAILPERMLRGIQIQRRPIHPVTVGELLTIELLLKNLTNQSKSLIQVQDLLPFVLGSPSTFAIETIAPHDTHHWLYEHPARQRGIYRWQTVTLRTAAPLGLFWCRRAQTVAAIAVVYPTVLPLTHCPFIDTIGRDANLQFSHDRRAQAASEGITRSLRPYRWGDSIRLIHWRTSARYGELRVRELETFINSQALVLCLDSATPWHRSTATPDASDPFEQDPFEQDPFEQAVIAAASLYFYAVRHNLSVKLWTAGTGLVEGNQTVLETLAAVQAGEAVYANSLPTVNLPAVPLIWLTQTAAGLGALPPGSRWLLWSTGDADADQRSIALPTPPDGDRAGIVIQPHQSLQLQLQGTLEKRLAGGEG